MPTAPSSPPSQRHPLVFFGEDWGRHPSTAQYLASQLLNDFDVTWINSIGLREPSLSLADLNRVIGKIQRALPGGSKGAEQNGAQASTAPTSESDQDSSDSSYSINSPDSSDVPDKPDAPHHLISPWILPWHRFAAAQAVNKALFTRQIQKQDQLTEGAYTVITANPASYYLLDTLKPQKSIYYCADKYAHIAGLNPVLVERFERELLERVDTVAATSLPLVDDLSKHHNNVHYLPHGVDFERFNKALDTKPLLEREASNSAQVVGFIGLLGEHIDFALIEACSQALTDVQFLFVGPVEQGITLPQAANIEYVGQVDQSALPGYLKRMDLCTLPYAMTDRNHYANPTKVREYLAAGRGVVATKQPGLQDIQGEVRIASTTQEYVEALQTQLAKLANQTPEECQSNRQAIASPMINETWQARAETLRAFIQSPS